MEQKMKMKKMKKVDEVIYDDDDEDIDGSDSDGDDDDGNNQPNYWQRRLETLKEKAKGATMPTAATAALTPSYIFDDQVLIIHICDECKWLNSTIKQLANGNQEMKFQLCLICSTMLNKQRTSKVFQL